MPAMVGYLNHWATAALRRYWRNSEVVRRQSNGRNDCRGNYENGRQGNQWLRAEIDFRRMIEDLTIGDTRIEMEIKRAILVEGTTEIGFRVKL
ncbi:hypothetical protein TNCV_4720761 [Trichonephila clavipes]|uniref:Uncharacterized protein n=1 Tax=Trichonephila clavipes TaxID=2585209 RepID=A0A8X6W644_TRICX|nr:hypothetical protein TNCV_4720761 [Trichonephila clavipes]